VTEAPLSSCRVNDGEASPAFRARSDLPLATRSWTLAISRVTIGSGIFPLLIRSEVKASSFSCNCLTSPLLIAGMDSPAH
jgi:hypothetical protein